MNDWVLVKDYIRERPALLLSIAGLIAACIVIGGTGRQVYGSVLSTLSDKSDLATNEFVE